MTTRSRRARGFTLTELMVVVVIAGLFASLAMISFKRSIASGDVDAFANSIRNAIMVARSRAITTGNSFIIDIRANSVAYCERDPASAPWPGGQKTCPTPANTVCSAGAAVPFCESSRVLLAGADAEVCGYALGVNRLGLGAGVDPALLIGAGYQLLATRNGAVDADPSTPVPDGFTVYLRRRGMPSTTTPRRVLVFPTSGQPRLLDRW